MTIDVLGTSYTIITKKYDEEEDFSRRSIAGFCDGYCKEIVLCDMRTYKGWENESESTISNCEKLTLRHEITHAFLNESGLSDNSFAFDGGWAMNEEMVDWIARQGTKIYKAWQEADCL